MYTKLSKLGSGSSFYMTYATDGGSMQSIFGTAERYVSGITASLSTDGKQIILTGNNTIHSVTGLSKGDLFYKEQG